jgi:hypothetical protein
MTKPGEHEQEQEHGPEHEHGQAPLRATLVAEADRIQIPPLPAGAIRRHGAARRARRRTLQTVAGSMAVLAIVSAAITIGPGWSSTPITSTNPPSPTSSSSRCKGTSTRLSWPTADGPAFPFNNMINSANTVAGLGFQSLETPTNPTASNQSTLFQYATPSGGNWLVNDTAASYPNTTAANSAYQQLIAADTCSQTTTSNPGGTETTTLLQSPRENAYTESLFMQYQSYVIDVDVEIVGAPRTPNEGRPTAAWLTTFADAQGAKLTHGQVPTIELPAGGWNPGSAPGYLEAQDLGTGWTAPNGMSGAAYGSALEIDDNCVGAGFTPLTLAKPSMDLLYWGSTPSGTQGDLTEGIYHLPAGTGPSGMSKIRAAIQAGCDDRKGTYIIPGAAQGIGNESFAYALSASPGVMIRIGDTIIYLTAPYEQSYTTADITWLTEVAQKAATRYNES